MLGAGPSRRLLRRWRSGMTRAARARRRRRGPTARVRSRGSTSCAVRGCQLRARGGPAGDLRHHRRVRQRQIDAGAHDPGHVPPSCGRDPVPRRATSPRSGAGATAWTSCARCSRSSRTRSRRSIRCSASTAISPPPRARFTDARRRRSNARDGSGAAAGRAVAGGGGRPVSARIVGRAVAAGRGGACADPRPGAAGGRRAGVDGRRVAADDGSSTCSNRCATSSASRSSTSRTIWRRRTTSATGVIIMRRSRVVEAGDARTVLVARRGIPIRSTLKNAVLSPEDAWAARPIR